MATYDSITVLDNLVKEELPSMIHESLPEIAPVYKYINQSAIGVQRDRGIGRQWQVEHLFDTGVGGLIQHANPVGPGMETNTYYKQAWVLDADSTTAPLAPFPTAASSPHPGSLKRVLTLQMATGNFNIPITWQSGDALTASQIKQVVRSVKAVGKLRALTEAQSFFMASNNTLCQIDNYDNTGEGSGYCAFTVKAGTGRTSFFRVGMMVDVVADSTGTPQWGSATDGSDRKNYTVSTEAYLPLIVADVDYISGVITLASVNGLHIEAGDLAGSAFADDDWVILRDCNTASREMRTWGLEDWIASSGQIMGGSSGDHALDLDTFSQFKSKVVAVSAPLTDTVMNGYVGGFLDAYPGASLDTIITTMGATLKYLEMPTMYNNRLNYDRTNKALSVVGGWNEVGYNFNGRVMNWMISPMCIGGYLYGIKMGEGNITRYVPPRVGGTEGNVGSEVEFMAPLAGSKSIFLPGRASTGAPQAILEAPFWQYTLVAPLDVRSVKLTGLTEATMS